MFFLWKECVRRLRWPAAVVVVIASPCVADVIDEPLQLGNRQPLVQIFNLPAMHSGEVLAADASEWRGAFDVANNFVRLQGGSESLLIDVESQRYEFGLRRGLGNGLEIGVLVPWISYNGGELDNLIDHWHQFWGLPRGGWPDYPAHQVALNYQRQGVTELDFHRAEAGFGDVQLNAAWQLSKSARNAVALAGHINLPTGDADKLTGSGKANAGLELAATHANWLDRPLTLTGNIGGLWLPRGDVLANQQKQSAWFASGEIDWAVAQDWRFKTQLQVHSALYNSELRALGSDAVQLLLGGTVRLSRCWLLDAAIGEDIAIDTAPDVTFQLALRANY